MANPKDNNYLDKQEPSSNIEEMLNSDVVDNIKDIETKYVEPNLNNMLKYLENKEVTPHMFAPNYLKKTEAEENLKND